jgi:hypothetical protein
MQSTHPHVVRSTVWRLVPLAVGVALLGGFFQRNVADLAHQSALGFGTWATVSIIAGYVARSRGASGSQAVGVAWWTNFASGIANGVLSWFGLGATTAASHAAASPQWVNLADLSTSGAWLLLLVVLLVVVGVVLLMSWVITAPFAMLGFWVHGSRETNAANPAL